MHIPIPCEHAQQVGHGALVDENIGVENIGDEEYKEFGNQQDTFGFTAEIFNRGRQWYLDASYEF